MRVAGDEPILPVSADERDRHKRETKRPLSAHRREDCYHARQPCTGADILSCGVSRADHAS